MHKPFIFFPLSCHINNRGESFFLKRKICKCIKYSSVVSIALKRFKLFSGRFLRYYTVALLGHLSHIHNDPPYTDHEKYV